MLLTDTAFHLLGVSVSDTKAAIYAQAEEKAFSEDEEACRRASRELCISSKRLTHELSWLPGVPAGSAAGLCASARQGDVQSLLEAMEEGLPPLAACNLLAQYFNGVQPARSPDADEEETADILQAFAEQYECLRAATILRDINCDRQNAGFPEVRQDGPFGEMFETRKRELVSAAEHYLQSAGRERHTGVLTAVLEKSTYHGTVQGYQLLDELADAYELSVSTGIGSCEQELVRNARRVLDELSGAGKEGQAPPALFPLLEAGLKAWRRLMLPILLSYASRGLQHRGGANFGRVMEQFIFQLYRDGCDPVFTGRVASALADTIEPHPGISERLRNSADMLGKEYTRKQQERLCLFFRNVPDSFADLQETVQEFQNAVSEASGGMDKATGTEVAGMGMKYAAALCNKHRQESVAVELLQGLRKLPMHADVRTLLEHNLRCAKENPAYRQKCKQDKERELIAWKHKYRILSLARKVSLIITVLVICFGAAAAIATIDFSRPSTPTGLMDEPVNSLTRQFIAGANGIFSGRPPTPQEAADKGSPCTPDALFQKYKGREAALDKRAIFRHVLTKESAVYVDWYLEHLADEADKAPLAHHRQWIVLKYWNKAPKPCTAQDIKGFMDNHPWVLTDEDWDGLIFADMVSSKNPDYLRQYEEASPSPRHKDEVEGIIRSWKRRSEILENLKRNEHLRPQNNSIQ